MREFFKQGIVQIFAQFGICTLMCGATIGFLISSGWLLLLSNEGRNKTFLIPTLIAFAVVIYAHIENKRTCHQKGFSSTGDKIWGMLLFMFLSGLITILFTLYVFIPWWIPNYQGGFLLP
jgi:carbon starvation protein CstA